MNVIKALLHEIKALSVDVHETCSVDVPETCTCLVTCIKGLSTSKVYLHQKSRCVVSCIKGLGA